jgi:ATP-dependent DNA helicase RecG
MNDEQLIKELIKQGESKQLEFKENVQKEDIAKIISSFLNAQGGIVLIGVEDKGKIIGIKNARSTQAVLEKYLINSIVPEAPITFSIERINKKDVMLVKVWNGSKPPYVFNGSIYFRKGSRTVKASPNDISKLIIERQQTELHWERQAASGVELDDLDQQEIRNTIKDLAEYGRGKNFKENQVEQFLTYYGLYQNGNLTNAAVVLFGKEPARSLPQCRTRLAVFSKSKTSDSFSHDLILEGNLFRNAEDIFRYFETNIASKSRFNEKRLRRIDVPFPKSALREGLMNALIHRDYSNISGTALIAFYSDRLEISNYGELPPELGPADLAKNHLSLPRNPDIAHICFLRGLIEKIGRGTIKMIEDCESKGFSRPKWESKSGVTTLTFPGITVSVKAEDNFDPILKTINEIIRKGLTDTVKLRLVKLISIISSGEGKKVADFVKRLKVSERTIKQDLKTLTEARLIKYTGSKKAGSYNLDKKLYHKLHN